MPKTFMSISSPSRLTFPSLLRKSPTWDKGYEMAKWNDLQEDSDIDVYICAPHSPWQQPSKEHMNGLLRKYFPKGTDLNQVTYEYLKFVAAEMDGRPRKVLGWKTRAEVYAEAAVMNGWPRPDRMSLERPGRPNGLDVWAHRTRESSTMQGCRSASASSPGDQDDPHHWHRETLIQAITPLNEVLPGSRRAPILIYAPELLTLNSLTL